MAVQYFSNVPTMILSFYKKLTLEYSDNNRNAKLIKFHFLQTVKMNITTVAIWPTLIIANYEYFT